MIVSRLTLFPKAGVCGGFTTFSTFAPETESLLEKGGRAAAVVYVLASLACWIAAVFLGQKIVK